MSAGRQEATMADETTYTLTRGRALVYWGIAVLWAFGTMASNGLSPLGTPFKSFGVVLVVLVVALLLKGPVERKFGRPVSAE